MRYREKALSQKESVCEACGSEKRIRVHHIDGDRDNNNIENLTILCEECHKRVHDGRAHLERIDELRAQLKNPYKAANKFNYETHKLLLYKDEKEWLKENTPDGMTLTEYIRSLIHDDMDNERVWE